MQRTQPIQATHRVQVMHARHATHCRTATHNTVSRLPIIPTVKTHVQRLYEKLGVSDRAAAVAEAMRQRLLD
ncbi:hypothetical protein GR254_12365 [Mycobacterium tuberculosis]|nr:hypothetical protein [Mycobacterium tuberculosis]